MTRPPSPGAPPPPFQPNIIAGTRIRGNERERAGVTKEKNKFDQSEGGGYRFGYSFRKRRRILFLCKPDKSLFTCIFSHTRRPCTSSHASEKRDGNITNGLPYRLYINQFCFRNFFFFVKSKIFKTGLTSNFRRGKSYRRNNFGECIL